MPNSAEKLLKFVGNIQEEKIIKFLINNEIIDVKQVQEILNIKEIRARKILSNLVKKGILKKIGKTKGSYYILREDKNV